MANTTTTLGRAKLVHPDLGYEGGAALETLVKAIYTRVSDFMNSRFFLADNLNNAASVDLDHNFKVAFSELKVVLYAHDEGTNELTRLVSGGSPNLDSFTIAATGGFATTKVTVTNNTGSQQDIAIMIIHADYAEKVSDLDDFDTTSAPTNLQVMQYLTATSKWTPRTLTVDSWNVTAKTANYSAAVFDKILADTSGGPFTIAIPSGASPGAVIQVHDSKGAFDSTNKVTLDVTTNTQKINGAATDKDLDAPGRYWLEYMNATYGWALYRNN